MLIGFFILNFGLNADRQQDQAAQQFQATPVCASSATTILQAANCRLEAPMLVTNKWVKYGEKGSRSYYLNLRSYSGDTYTMKIIMINRLWASVSVGQEVGTERWQDNVVLISANGLTAPTTDYPGAAPGTVHDFWGAFGASFLGVSVILLVASIIWWRVLG
jgi:hypothetical protein